MGMLKKGEMRRDKISLRANHASNKTVCSVDTESFSPASLFQQ
jgi:hypothetical protein